MARKMLAVSADWDKLAQGDIEESYKLLNQHGKLIAKITAIAILDSWWKIPLFTRVLANWLTWHLQGRKFTEILLMLQIINSPADFTNTIRLLRTSTMTTLIPKNLSPNEKGS
jgi:hypothetical protein